jgi:hypothetical protein
LKKSRHNLNNIENFYNLITKLKYKEVYKFLKLIEDESITIFIPQIIEVEEKIDNMTIKKTLNGIDIWKQYFEFIENKSLPYAEKQIKLSRLKKEFSYFTYNVKYKPSFKYSEVVGENMYLLDMNEYITNGKFDRKK